MVSGNSSRLYLQNRLQSHLTAWHGDWLTSPLIRNHVLFPTVSATTLSLVRRPQAQAGLPVQMTSGNLQACRKSCLREESLASRGYCSPPSADIESQWPIRNNCPGSDNFPNEDLHWPKIFRQLLRGTWCHLQTHGGY